MTRRLLITYPFPLGRATGGARMTREIARHLGKAGVEVVVLAVSADYRKARYPRLQPEAEALGFEFDEELAADGVRIERVAQHPLHVMLDARSVRDAVARELDRAPTDVVLSYYKEAAFLPDLLARRGVRFGFISTWQSYAQALRVPQGGWRGRLKRLINRRTVERPHKAADVFFATSGFTRDELVQELDIERERIHLCPLGVRPHFFDVPALQPGPVERYLFFGRIIPPKGVADALRAFATLPKGSWKLRLVGQGRHAWAAELAAELGIGDAVEVYGPADDAELVEHLSWSQVAVLPSHFEAFGLAFAEAQASGRSVVAFAAGSVPEVVRDGTTGWLAPLHDGDALAAALAATQADPEETVRRGAAARLHVQTSFTWERTAEVILKGLEGPSAPSGPGGPGTSDGR